MYITYKEHTTGGEVEDPTDRWSSHEDEIREFYITGLYLDDTPLGQFSTYLKESVKKIDFVPKKGDICYTVVVRYQTGNTFGRILGCWSLIGVFKDLETAKKIEDDIRSWKGDYEVGTYPPWEGYFERLQDVEIETWTLD